MDDFALLDNMQAKQDFQMRVDILESIAEAARNYHELFEVGPGRNAVANCLASLIHRLDELERGLTRAGADAPSAFESNQDSPADAPSDAMFIPDGWKLVPFEPTNDMIDAAGMGWIIRKAELRKRVRIYQAMVEAAQIPPDRGFKPTPLREPDSTDE